MLIKQIADIELTNPLWWTNYNEPIFVSAEIEKTIDGGIIVYEQQLQNDSININLSSIDNGWQSLIVKNALILLAKNSFRQTFNITTWEDEIIEVRFRHESNPLLCSRVIQAYNSEYYNCELNLAMTRG